MSWENKEIRLIDESLLCELVNHHTSSLRQILITVHTIIKPKWVSMTENNLWFSCFYWRHIKCMSHYNLISLAVKHALLNIDWGLVFIIYSKYPGIWLIWLIKSIIAPRGGLSTQQISTRWLLTGEQDILYLTSNIVMMAYWEDY